jgi:hypothetical protein
MSEKLYVYVNDLIYFEMLPVLPEDPVSNRQEIQEDIGRHGMAVTLNLVNLVILDEEKSGNPGHDH